MGCPCRFGKHHRHGFARLPPFRKSRLTQRPKEARIAEIGSHILGCNMAKRIQGQRASMPRRAKAIDQNSNRETDTLRLNFRLFSFIARSKPSAKAKACPRLRALNVWSSKNHVAPLASKDRPCSFARSSAVYTLTVRLLFTDHKGVSASTLSRPRPSPSASAP